MNMTEPVTIEKCTEGRDANGAPTRTFADQSPEIWAKIEYPGGREFRAVGQAAAEADAAFIIRSNSGLTERDRLRTLDGLKYEITYILPQDRTPFQRVFGRALKP